MGEPPARPLEARPSRWEIRCRGAVQFAVARSAFFVTTFPATAGVVTGRVPEIRWRARRVFSRAPRARPDLSVSTRDYPRARLSILALKTSSHPAQEACSRTRLSGFANRAEAHVDRRGDEVRVPRPLEVLSSIPRGLVIGGDIRGLSGVILSRRRATATALACSRAVTVGVATWSAKCLQLRTTRLHTRASAP